MSFLSQASRRMFLACMVAVSVGIAGCASTGSSMVGGAKPDPRLTKGTEASFFSRSGMQACAGAAAVGVAACMLTAKGDNKLMCSIAAGVAACGIAMGTNYYLDQRRKEYSNTAQLLDAIATDIDQDTEKLRQRATTIEEVIESDKQKMVALEADLKQQKLEESAARDQLAGVDANIQRMKRELDNVDKRIASYREASATTPDGAVLDARIQELQAEAAKLHNAMGSLMAQRDSLDWGKQA